MRLQYDPSPKEYFYRTVAGLPTWKRRCWVPLFREWCNNTKWWNGVEYFYTPLWRAE